MSCYCKRTLTCWMSSSGTNSTSYECSSRWRNITFIHIKNRQSLSTRSVWFPLFYGGSWKTSSWFLLYIGLAQLIRRRVKIDQLWICFSFWWHISNNRLFVLIFVTVYHDVYIENLLLRLILFTFRIKLKPPPPSNEWFYFEPPPPLFWQQFYAMPPPLVFQPPSW